MTKDCPQNNVRQLGDNLFFLFFIHLFSIIYIYIFFLGGGGGGEGV